MSRLTNLYQVYDTVTGSTIGPIFTAYAHAAATRVFTDTLLDQNSPMQLSRHPEDYELRHLGRSDETTGQLEGLDKPETILTGHDYVNSRKPSAQ